MNRKDLMSRKGQEVCEAIYIGEMLTLLLSLANLIVSLCGLLLSMFATPAWYRSLKLNQLCAAIGFFVVTLLIISANLNLMPAPDKQEEMTHKWLARLIVSLHLGFAMWVFLDFESLVLCGMTGVKKLMMAFCLLCFGYLFVKLRTAEIPDIDWEAKLSPDTAVMRAIQASLEETPSEW